MTRLLRLLAALALLAATPARAGAELAELVDGDADLLLAADRLPTLVRGLKEHPLTRAFNGDGLRWAFTATRNRYQLDRLEEIARGQVGFPLERLIDAFSGPAVLALAGQGEQQRFVLIAEVGDQLEPAGALLDHLLREPPWAGKGVRHELAQEEFRGVKLHLRVAGDNQGATAGAMPGWAAVGPHLVLAWPREQLERTVEDLQAGASRRPWAATDGYRALRRDYPQAHLHLELRSERLIDLIDERFNVARRIKGEKLDEKQRAALDRADKAFKELMAGLELNALESVAGAAWVEEAATRFELDLHYRQERGVLTLFTFGDKPARLPPFLPDGMTEVDSARFSLNRFWGALQQLGQKLPPVSAWTGQVRAHLTESAEGRQLDLERLLLAAVGEELVRGSFPVQIKLEGRDKPYDYPGTFLAISLADERSMQLAAESLFDTEGYEETEYLEAKLHVERATPEAGPFGEVRSAWAISDGWLLFASSPEPLREAITRLRRPERSDGLWQRPELKPALARLPADAAWVRWYEPLPLMEQFAETLIDHQRELTRTPGQCPPPIDIEKKDLTGWLDGVVTTVSRRPGRYHLRAEMLHHAAR